MSPDELRQRRQELIPGLLERATEVVDVEDGLRLRFTSSPGLLMSLASVTEQEQSCCSFLRFRILVEPHAGDVELEVTGPAGTREMLRAL